MIRIYSQQMKLQAILENAFDISYEERLNELWVASFSLPANDPKTTECLPFRFVEIYDGDERVDLFRILPQKTQRGGDGSTITYDCEHVLATLIDDVLFQYHQVGGLGYPTPSVLQYILDRQIVRRWQLGTVDFARQFEYKFENDSVLGGLFAVPKPFDEPFQWTWDTTTTPWTLNLIRPADAVQSYIRYGVNLIGITKQEDPTEIATRIYALGYGEGVNQLDIRSVNPTGLPYIDADTQGVYGVVSKIWTDRRYEYADTLFAAAKAMLEQLKTPKLTYTVDGAELYRLTNDPIDRFRVGTVVWIQDEELGIDVEARVVVRSRPDVTGSPGEVRLQIANKTDDIAGSIADLDERQRINEVTAQGATCLDSHNFADNADPTHPAKMRFFIPEEMVRINKLLLSYQSSSFRAYSRAIEGGGGFAQSFVSESGGFFQTTETSSTDGMVQKMQTSSMAETSLLTTGDSGVEVQYGYGQTFSASGPDLPGHSHIFNQVIGHKHYVTIPGHQHQVEILIPGHQHQVGIFIPPHTHQVQVVIPPHVHGIEYGIFEGPTPSQLQIRVDGNLLPISDTDRDDVDILPYLSKDGGGRVQRGAWHEIEITPDSLGRITANVVIQIFVQSRGGMDA
ncbi:hypothetical protein VE23_24895 [Paenibacillus sp. D9]|uniref:phage tail spike protein n=1 Tax=Paenibacillus sp. D9 TaxID=665792 RepID=UPI00061E1143|nr:phage tail spike protein [Paenibacillus sp. D9]KKC49539.1 hypothetical protein VE23_24895 [Paenibacillus sp. D9]